MRLSSQQQTVIKQTLAKHFGESSEIRLFGSRLDDNARGGDIDVYIEPELTAVDEIIDAKLNALVELHQQLGEQKIDLVINRKSGLVLPIYQVAKQQGVLL
ncbi:MAG: nucleotidyltransferase domain-containing protein [Alkalimonas sp.]|nr:nucleotidyltransferase domain-containing protein [Alkalimonas sp.]